MAGSVESRARAAILAGGRATRLGGAKAMTELAGRPLIAFPLAAATAAGVDPFVVAKRDTALPDLGCEVVIEPDQPIHPLRGILTALEHADGPVLALGCDMPFLTAELLAWLAAHEPPAAAEVAGKIEPLLAIYGPGDAPTMRVALDEEAPLRRAVERLGPKRPGERELRRFGDPRRLVASVNTEGDLAEAARLIAG